MQFSFLVVLWALESEMRHSSLRINRCLPKVREIKKGHFVKSYG